MTLIHLFLILGTLSAACAQSQAVLTNLATAKWTHDKGDPPGTESVMLRADEATGGMDLLVRFPAGHVFKPHSHQSNERIIVLEGQLTLKRESGDSSLDEGEWHSFRRGRSSGCHAARRRAAHFIWPGMAIRSRIRQSELP